MKRLLFAAVVIAATVSVARQPSDAERAEFAKNINRVPCAAKVPFKLGIAGYTYFRQSTDYMLDMMQKMDIHYLCIKDFHLDYTRGAEAPIAAFKAKCKSAGVETLAAGPLYFDNEPLARKFFEFAKACGIKRVVVVPCEMREIDGKKVRAESEAMLDVLEGLCREFDIVAGIHNHGPDIPYLFPTAEAVWARIKNRDRRIGFCLDVGHQRRAGNDPVEAIRKYANRIYDVHLKNIKVDAECNIAMPGPRGELEIPRILQALADVGYDGVCHIEYERDFLDNAMGLAESIGYYRGVMDTLKVKAKMLPAPANANVLTDAEKAEGWQLAWDGHSFDGWLSVKSGCKSAPDRGWVIKDGTLTMRPVNGIANGKWFPLPPEDQKLGGGGDIVTAKKYRDFAFKFDFRLTEAANSGVKYFYDETKNRGTCEEYQILENGHPDSDKGKDGNRKSASLYDVIPAHADNLLKPLGGWNSGMIVSRGRHVEHWLNGVKVLEYERGSNEFKALVKASKYADWGDDGKDWGELVEGRILLQDHSDSTVSFCNLKIREL